jgi:threonine synthase
MNTNREGAATVAALRALLEAGLLQADEQIVCLNTGTNLHGALPPPKDGVDG